MPSAISTSVSGVSVVAPASESVCDEKEQVDSIEQAIEEKVGKIVSNVENAGNGQKRVKSVADSEAGATTETPETEVEMAEGIVKAKSVCISEKISQKTENLKIKSKVSIILREPKCPSQLNNGFSQVRTACP
jgi:hypothetical protein